MPNIIDFSPQRAVDLNGFAIPGALATFYDAGTTRERVVYADPDCTIPHPVPVVADGAGVFPPVYDTGGDVRVIVTDAAGVTLAGYPIDPASTVRTEAQGASGLSFEPTASIPEKDVQAAIERVQANILTPLADYGLGVVGAATLCADIDAQDIASGFYRFGATSAGTFPTGVTPVQNGVVLLFRRSAADAVMLLIPKRSHRIYRRYLNEGVWSSWDHLVGLADAVSGSVWAAGTSTVATVISPSELAAQISADLRSWQVVTGSRNANVTYRNTTGRTIQVIIQMGAYSSGSVLSGSTAGAMAIIYSASDWGSWQMVFDVPHRGYYRLDSQNAPLRWSELR